MKTRLGVPVLLLVLLALVPAAPAAAFNWGIGADLGYNMFMPSSDYGDVENINSFGWPSGGSFMGVLPGFGGLRVSFAGAEPTHEIWLGTSLNLLSSGGSSIHAFGVNANYQYNFPSKGPMAPYVTAGVGLNQVGESDGGSLSAMSTIFGGGVGIAHHMGNGCGRLRAEVRFDVQTEGEEDGDVIIPKGSNLGIRLGFDLWNK